MNAQDIILAAINSKIYTNLIMAMIIAAFWFLGEISSTEMSSDLALINWTYDSTAHTFSDGSTTYSAYDLINTCCTTVYTKVIELGKFTMSTVIDAAATETYITSAQATELKGKLVSA